MCKPFNYSYDASGHQQRVQVKAGGGGYLAVWHDLRNQAANGADIYGAYQLIGGDLVKELAPVPYHQMVSMRIGFELVKFVEERDLGVVLHAPMDVYLSDTEVYQPDIMFISKDRVNITPIMT